MRLPPIRSQVQTPHVTFQRCGNVPFNHSATVEFAGYVGIEVHSLRQESIPFIADERINTEQDN
jgi:hypothetical protein